MSTATIEPRPQAASRGPGLQIDAAPAPFGTGRPLSGESDRRHRPPARLLVLLGFLGALSAFVLYRFEATPTTGPARIALQGNIDVRQVILSFKVGGRIERLLVDEGDTVEAGQLVAALDERYFQDELQLARSSRNARAATLARLLHGSRPEEIAQARALVAEREASAANAGVELRRSANLLARNAGSRQDYDGATATARVASAQLASAREALRLAEIGPRVEDIDAARADLSAAEAELTQAQRRLEDARLVAPGAGVILTRAREAGAIVQPGETAFTLTLASPVWVRTYVDEADLGNVRPGMAVSVVTDTPGGRTYTGRVGFISPTAEFTPKTVETRELRTALVYRLRVVVDDPDGGLRQGMPVGVKLDLPGPRPLSFRERLTQVLWLDRLGLTSSQGGR